MSFTRQGPPPVLYIGHREPWISDDMHRISDLDQAYVLGADWSRASHCAEVRLYSHEGGLLLARFVGGEEVAL